MEETGTQNATPQNESNPTSQTGDIPAQPTNDTGNAVKEAAMMRSRA